MKNISIIILALLLIGTIIAGFIFFGKYVDCKNIIEANNKKISELDKNIGKLTEENSKLSEQLSENVELVKNIYQLKKERTELYEKMEKNAQSLKELEKLIQRNKDLEEAIEKERVKVSRLNEKIKQVEKKLKEEKETDKQTREELSLKEDAISTLQEEIQEKKSDIKELRDTSDSLISELKEQIKNNEMTIQEYKKKLSITMLDSILFDFGEATMTPEGDDILTKVGDVLKNVHGMQIWIIGHTDDVPIKEEYQYKFPSNWELSAARAASVARYFQTKSGVDPQALTVVGRSYFNPIASNETDEGRAKNRRVEIIIGPKLERK